MTTADAIHDAFVRQDPKFRGVIVVIDSHGYHVRAYQVPKVVADSVDQLMNQSATDHGPDPYATTSAFVSKLAGVHVPANAPVATSAVAHEARRMGHAEGDAGHFRPCPGDGRAALVRRAPKSQAPQGQSRS